MLQQITLEKLPKVIVRFLKRHGVLELYLEECASRRNMEWAKDWMDDKMFSEKYSMHRFVDETLEWDATKNPELWRDLDRKAVKELGEGKVISGLYDVRKRKDGGFKIGCKTFTYSDLLKVSSLVNKRIGTKVVISSQYNVTKKDRNLFTLYGDSYLFTKSDINTVRRFYHLKQLK